MKFYIFSEQELMEVYWEINNLVYDIKYRIEKNELKKLYNENSGEAETGSVAEQPVEE